MEYEKTETIHVCSSEGKQYIIFVCTKYEITELIDGKRTKTELEKNLKTSEGFSVNRIDEDHFKIIIYDPKKKTDTIIVEKIKK